MKEERRNALPPLFNRLLVGQLSALPPAGPFIRIEKINEKNLPQIALKDKGGFTMPSRSEQFELRFFNFAVETTIFSENLPKTKRGLHLSDQLFRSATAVGAHMREARSAESKADLIHKMQIALKEIREAHYWLGLIESSGIVRNELSGRLVQEANELTAILVTSVRTAKGNERQTIDRR